MPSFHWVGRNFAGTLVRGVARAASRDALLLQLRQRRIEPIAGRIREKGKGLTTFSLPGLEKRAKAQDVIAFTRQFAAMVGAGVPIVQALEILKLQSENKVMQSMVTQVAEDVKSGTTLAEAFKKQERVFSDLYVHMVAAGETGGILDAILVRLSVYLEKAQKLRRKIRGAMIYPASIALVAIAVTLVLLVYVIPVFADLFSSFGQSLPAPTQFVIELSNFTIRNALWLVLLVFALAAGARLSYRSERGRTVIDGIFLKLPIFGDLVCKGAVARFSRTLGTLISSGVPIIDALTVTAKTAGNRVVERTLFETRAKVTEGKPIAEPLSASKIFPPMVANMVQIGETTGALDQMLGKVADFYEEEVDNAVQNLTALMEPLVMVILGVIMGGLIISMYLPIFKLSAVAGS